MKLFSHKIFSLYFIFLIICITNCNNNNSVEPDLSIDLNLIGTWDLTKISTNVAGQNINYTPEEAGVNSTVIFKEDFTFESVSINQDTTINETGTWTASAGILTITIVGKTPQTTPYTLDKNKIYIGKLVNIENSGQVFATAEYTKRSL